MPIIMLRYEVAPRGGRFFAKAWPAFVAIVIVSGLMVQAFTWEQLGEFKVGLLGLPPRRWSL